MIFLLFDFLGCVALGTGAHASLVAQGKVGQGEAAFLSAMIIFGKPSEPSPWIKSAPFS